MGRKVHPLGFRLGIIKEWQSRWFADRTYTDQLHEDIRLRALIHKRLPNASLSRIDIERSAANQIEVTLFTAKPGIVIGKGGQAVELLRKDLEDFTGKKVKLNIHEIKQPEMDAYLVAESIADQLTRRVSYKRAMKQAVQRAMRLGAKGMKIRLGGRLGGAEMARIAWEKDGRVPLHTIRADIDYGQVHAHTTYGRIGVKVWIYKGDVIGPREPGGEMSMGGEMRGGRGGDGRGRGGDGRGRPEGQNRPGGTAQSQGQTQGRGAGRLPASPVPGGAGPSSTTSAPQVVSGTRNAGSETPQAPHQRGAFGDAGRVGTDNTPDLSTPPALEVAMEMAGQGAVMDADRTYQGHIEHGDTRIGAGTPEDGEVYPTEPTTDAPQARDAQPDLADALASEPPPSQAEGAREDEDQTGSPPSQAALAEENEGLAEAPGDSGTAGAPNVADADEGAR